MNPLGHLIASLLVCVPAFAAPEAMPTAQARRMEVLFMGAPTANAPYHDPIERYRETRKHLGVAGINFTYTEELADLNPATLARYDALMLYANWDTLAPEQERALNSYVEAGHGFLAIHSASACFGHSDSFIKLVGGRFVSHGSGEFETTITAPDHPIMRGYTGFRTWDETYVHDRPAADRTLLQKRDDEPWTWVREQGRGRVFYTAYGHDMRCWSQPAFQELLRRAILWSVGDQTRARWLALKLPERRMEPVRLPNYHDRKVITEAQSPLPAHESIKLAQIPQGFEISLFASEPEILNPIHIAWDEKGRAYVVETVDYPNDVRTGGTGNDRITLCEDTDGDGRADKFTRFAESLSLPTSIVIVNGGVISTNNREMIFLKDTDGDGKADERKVLFSGFGMSDTHAGVSNLHLGFDNWIYATVGYSGFDGEVGGEHHRFSQGVFRFKQDGSKLEFLQNTTNNTWGLGFTSDFDLLGSTANANPSWYTTFPEMAYRTAGLEPPKTPAADKNPLLFPSSLDIRQVDVVGGYTAAAGHAFLTSERFPSYYRDRIALVCEPTGKLVGQFVIGREQSGYTAAELPNNLFSSADAWTSPVFANEGPDGAVWICDWYNLIVQHNPTPTLASAGLDAENGAGNAYKSPIRDRHMGRIYRVYPRGSANDPYPALNPADPHTLVRALRHPNLFWRLQAQRLMVENRVLGAVPMLEEFATSSEPGAIQAFNTLHGLDLLKTELLHKAARSSQRGLRRAARNAVPASAALSIRDGTLICLDGRDLAETLAALGQTPPSDEIGRALYEVLAAKGASFSSDRTLSDGWKIAASQHAYPLLLTAATVAPHQARPDASAHAPNLLPNPSFSQQASSRPEGWTLRHYIAAEPEKVVMKIMEKGRTTSCLMIQSPVSADVGASADVDVLPNRRYRLSGWVRTDNLKLTHGMGAMLNVHGLDARTKAIHGTTDWTLLETEFSTGEARQIRVHCLFGGYGGATGAAWWDDVSLTLIGEEPEGFMAGPLRFAAERLAATGLPEEISKVTATVKARNDALGDHLAVALVGRLRATPEVRKFQPDIPIHRQGEEIYNRTCVACHGIDGQGVAGAFPPLDGSEWVVNDEFIPIRIVLHGLSGPVTVNGATFNGTMPPHPDLTDEEVANVLTFVRQSWSNDAAPISTDTVTSLRSAPSRTTPWIAEELKR